MVVQNRLNQLAARIALGLPGRITAQEVERILNSYQEAYPDTELTDQSANGLKPGDEVVCDWPSHTTQSGQLLFIKRVVTTDRYGQQQITEQEGIVLLAEGKHTRVPWGRIRTPKHQPPNDREAGHGSPG